MHLGKETLVTEVNIFSNLNIAKKHRYGKVEYKDLTTTTKTVSVN